jgi:hypothetical protein
VQGAHRIDDRPAGPMRAGCPAIRWLAVTERLATVFPPSGSILHVDMPSTRPGAFSSSVVIVNQKLRPAFARTTRTFLDTPAAAEAR